MTINLLYHFMFFSFKALPKSFRMVYDKNSFEEDIFFSLHLERTIRENWTTKNTVCLLKKSTELEVWHNNIMIDQHYPSSLDIFALHFDLHCLSNWILIE